MLSGKFQVLPLVILLQLGDFDNLGGRGEVKRSFFLLSYFHCFSCVTKTSNVSVVQFIENDAPSIMLCSWLYMSCLLNS